MSEPRSITVRVPINMALVKYWGKRDVQRMLPLNDSLSVCVDALYAVTTLTASNQIGPDEVVVNGKTMTCDGCTRYATCFNQVRRLLRKRSASGDGDTGVHWKLQINSTTNFPVEAGLASSAAGFAAIAFAFGRLFELDDRVVMEIARTGSGSACRSLQSGFVHWQAGVDSEGADCTCVQLQPATHWPTLRMIIAVVSSASKQINSSTGMARSVETSELLKYRAEHVVPKRIALMKKAIDGKDFLTLSELVMAEGRQVHAICLDTKPPIMYLTPASLHLIAICESFNSRSERSTVKTNTPTTTNGSTTKMDSPRVAYTFDAGPNCCFLLEENVVDEFMCHLVRYAPPSVTESSDQNRVITDVTKYKDSASDSLFNEDGSELTVKEEAVQYFIISNVGGGPHVIDS